MILQDHTGGLNRRERNEYWSGFHQPVRAFRLLKIWRSIYICLDGSCGRAYREWWRHETHAWRPCICLHKECSCKLSKRQSSVWTNVHELYAWIESGQKAVDEFRPLLIPFLRKKTKFDKLTLSVLAKEIIAAIYSAVSKSCDSSPVSLAPLAKFIRTLRSKYITRIYTTNYDDFPLQAAPDLYTGFDGTPRPGPKRFEVDAFWEKLNEDSLFHLHGSVHMGFSGFNFPKVNIGEILWFDSRAEAFRHKSFSGSDELRMDGSTFKGTLHL